MLRIPVLLEGIMTEAGKEEVALWVVLVLVLSLPWVVL